MSIFSQNEYNIKFSPRDNGVFSLPDDSGLSIYSPKLWQENALLAFGRKTKLAALVSPGGGKTKLSQFLMAIHRATFPIQIVTSPRNGINEQWTRAVKTIYGDCTVTAQYQFFDGDESVRRFIDALKGKLVNPLGPLVTSHATLCAAFDQCPEAFDFDNMCFVGDEIHHASEDADFGKIWRKACASKGMVIGLTGTPTDTLRRDLKEYDFTVYKREKYEHLADIGIKLVTSIIVEFDEHPLNEIVNNLNPEKFGMLVILPSARTFWRFKGSTLADPEQLVEELIQLLLIRGFKREEIADTITQTPKREQLLKELKKPGNPHGYKVILTNKYINEGIDIDWLRESHNASMTNSYVVSGQVEGRLTRPEKGKEELTYYYYVPTMCKDQYRLEFYEDRISAGLISSFSEDLIPELAKLKYSRVPQEEDEPKDGECGDDEPNDIRLTPREAFGDAAWDKVRQGAFIEYLQLPSSDNPQQSMKDAIREVVDAVVEKYKIKLGISLEDAVDAVYKHVKDAIYREKAKCAQMSFEDFMETLRDSEEFPHLLDHETFMGIAHTPENMERMHRAYLSHKEKEWDDRFDVFKAKRKLAEWVWNQRGKRLQRKAISRKVRPETLEIVSWGKDQFRSMEQGKLNPSQAQRFGDLMKEIQREVDNKPKPVVVETPEMKKIVYSKPTPRSFGAC